MLWLYKISMRTMSIDSPWVIGLEIKSLNNEGFILKKIGILIPSPWSGDYRSFFNPLSPVPLNIEIKQ
ncbi:unnamed protein product, partial [Arabidopsis halleri]